ncbi:MAG TPA: hypothetical protein VF011_14685 [Terriglobales bacterium]
MSTNPVTAPRSAGTRKSKLKSILLRALVVMFVLWAIASATVYAAMRRPPEQFGRFMMHVPGPVAFLALPFETMWMRARAGSLQVGDPAPDFSLMKLDKSGQIQLSALLAKQPVVLVFGSYT